MSNEGIVSDLDRLNFDEAQPKQTTSKTQKKPIKQMSDARRREIMNNIKETKDSKEHINLVVIGHVDAGKSTLMGHLLFLKGQVSQKTMTR